MSAGVGQPRWRAGVIAAGRGERLQTGAPRLKPLVSVAGSTLIDRVLQSLSEVAPSEVVLIVNEDSLAVREHVLSQSWPFDLRWIVQTTPSSMHSFLLVVEALASTGDAGPFLISTVDTVATPGTFSTFGAACRRSSADVTLAVAPPDDDEKPLLVRLDHGSRVEAIGARAAGAPWATSGFYAVRPSILREAAAARRDGLMALRAFLERLLDSGYDVQAIPVAAGVDVDRPSDIHAAEAFLRQAEA